ncbi:non-specific serine/threonine protein kinase [Trifolium repens]|nr:non-specific serine/threonine protein kinase [Trifolium repens]
MTMLLRRSDPVVLVLAGIQLTGKISPGFEGSQMTWIDKDGMFLVSNKQEFSFGFVRTSNDSTLFLLAIVHIESTRIVWTANRESPVSNSDKIVFDEKGPQSPQPYWSMQKDNRKTVNENGDEVASATLDENSWKFYDKEKSLLWQFIISDVANSIWIAVLGSDGFITFYNLQSRGSSIGSSKTIPKDYCSTPQPCGPYNICNGDKKCSCLSVLSSRHSCEPGFVSPCNSKSSIELMKGDDGLNYFALGFLQPSSKTDLIGCKNSCSVNCSCLAMFFQKSSGNCYLLDRIGSFEKTDNDSGFVSYVKVSRDGSTDTGENGNKNKQIIVVVIIVIVTLFIISGMIYVGLKNIKKKEKPSESPEEISDDEANFLEDLYCCINGVHFPLFHTILTIGYLLLCHLNHIFVLQKGKLPIRKRLLDER